MTAEPIKPAPPVTTIAEGCIACPIKLRRNRRISEVTRKATEERKCLVAVDEKRGIRVYRPRDRQGRIVPEQAALVLPRVLRVNLVENLRRGFQRAKAMGKARRYEELV